MKSGEKLLELELGPKRSKKYKRIYRGIYERVSKKLCPAVNELQLIEKFLLASEEFNKYKPKNKNNEFLHTSIRKMAFNNYNLFFLMKDCLKDYHVNVNLFTVKGVYYIKTENYLIFGKKIMEIDNFHRKENDDFFVLNDNLIHVNTYRRLSNIYKLIDVKKSEEYDNILKNEVDRYYNINTILNLNFHKLTIELINKISRNYENYEINYIKGLIYMKEKQYDFAEYEFKKVLSMDKSYIGLLPQLSLCLAKQKKYKEALKYYEEIQDKDYETLFEMGLIYTQMKKYDKAIEHFTDSIMANERYEESYVHLCMCLIKEREFERARNIVEEGVSNIGRREIFRKLLEKIKAKEEKYSKNPIIIIDLDKSIYRAIKEVKA